MLSTYLTIRHHDHQNILFLSIQGIFKNLSNIYDCTTTTTTTKTTTELSRLAWVRNFRFNSLSPILSIVRILSSQAISFQVLLPFPRYFKLNNLTYLGVDVSTDNMTIQPQTTLNHHIFYLHNKTYHISKNNSRHSMDQSHSTHHPDHTTIHPKQPRLTATVRSHVSQEYNKTSQ